MIVNIKMPRSYELKNQFGQFYTGGPIVFLPDGKKFLFCSGNYISMCDMISKKIKLLKFGLRSIIITYDVDRTGKYLAIIDDTNLLLIVSVDEHKIKNKIVLKNRCCCIKWSPAGKYIVLGINKLAQVWKCSLYKSSTQASFQLSRTYIGNYSEVLDLDWNLTGDFFISAGNDGIIKIFSFRKKNRFAKMNFVTLKEKIIFIKFFTLSNKFLIFCKNNEVFIHELMIEKKKPRRNKFLTSSIKNSSKIKFVYRKSSVTCLWLNVFSKILLVGCSDGNIEMLNMNEFLIEKKKKVCFFNRLQNVKLCKIFLFQINAISVCKNNKYIVVGNFKAGKVAVYDQEKKKIIIIYENAIYTSCCISISLNDKLSITGNYKGKINIWSTKTGFCLMKFQNHVSAVNSVYFFKNSSRLALSSSRDGTVKIYDLKKCLVIRSLSNSLPNRDFDVADSSFSGFFIISACKKTFSICIWSIRTGKEIELLDGHHSYISSLYFVGKKLKIVSGSWDKTFRLWNFERNNISDYDYFCEIFRTYSRILKMDIHPNSFEIALLMLHDSIFFFDISKWTPLARIRKSVQNIFKNFHVDKRFFFKFSLIYSFNGKNILLGNLKNKIFSYSRLAPFPVQIYSIPFLGVKSKYFYFYTSKKKKRNKKKKRIIVDTNNIIQLSSYHQKDRWVALSNFGVFVFDGFHQLKHDYIFSFFRKFNFFLSKTILWVYMWKKINVIKEGTSILKKLFCQFSQNKKNLIRKNSNFYQILKIFSNQKNISLDEFCSMYDSFSHLLSTKGLVGREANWLEKIKKNRNRFKEKLYILNSRLYFLINMKGSLN